jgi:hypothetical protein
MTTYNLLPNYRKADILRKEAIKANRKEYQAFANQKLEQYNIGLISADEYYTAVTNAKLLVS